MKFFNKYNKPVTAFNITTSFLKYKCPKCEKYHINESNNDLSNRVIKVIPACEAGKFFTFFRKVLVSINENTIKYH